MILLCAIMFVFCLYCRLTPVCLSLYYRSHIPSNHLRVGCKHLAAYQPSSVCQRTRALPLTSGIYCATLLVVNAVPAIVRIRNYNKQMPRHCWKYLKYSLIGYNNSYLRLSAPCQCDKRTGCLADYKWHFCQVVILLNIL